MCGGEACRSREDLPSARRRVRQPVVFRSGGGLADHREPHDAPSRRARVYRVRDCAQETRRVRACIKHVHAAVQRAGQAIDGVLICKIFDNTVNFVRSYYSVLTIYIL